MNDILTFHANARFSQRGITHQSLETILEYGEQRQASGGATMVFLTKRNAAKIICSLKKKIKEIEKATSKVIIEKEGRILTGYHI